MRKCSISQLISRIAIIIPVDRTIAERVANALGSTTCQKLRASANVIKLKIFPGHRIPEQNNRECLSNLPRVYLFFFRWLHLLFNLGVQVVVGLPLEMVHGSLRIAAVYMAGVLAGE